jgi:hypothetical protein
LIILGEVKMNGVTYVKGSKNSKLGDKIQMDATYASIDSTCPDTCALKSSGCYAQTSFVGITNARLNQEAKTLTNLQVARAEARAIREAYKFNIVKETYLRIHVSGDTRTRNGVRSINSAVKTLLDKGLKKAYSYTHSWRNVPRKLWSNVSILASVDDVSQVAQARENGYAPALVVSEFASDKAFKMEGSDVTFIPCPAQTREVTCGQCKLCMKADFLYENNKGIAFAAHGVGNGKIKKRLNVIK